MEKETIEQVKFTARIEEVIGDYVQLKKSGANFMGKCPMCNNNKPKMSVSPSKQIFKCFACNSGGNVFTFLMKHKGIGFIDSVKIVAERYHIEVK